MLLHPIVAQALFCFIGSLHVLHLIHNPWSTRWLPWNTTTTLAEIISSKLDGRNSRLVGRSKDAHERQNGLVVLQDHSRAEQMLMRSQVVLKLNSTILHDAPVVDGQWRLPGVAIPDDWLCVKLSQQSDVDEGMQNYACMAKTMFALQYEDSLKLAARNDSLDTAPKILLVVLGLSIFPLVYLLMYVFVYSRQHPIIDKVWNGTVQKEDINDDFSRGLLEDRCACASHRCHCT